MMLQVWTAFFLIPLFSKNSKTNIFSCFLENVEKDKFYGGIFFLLFLK